MAITISGDSPNFSSATITSGTITTGTITTGTITTGTITTLNAPSGVLATQNGMAGIAKAWVNFNGTNGTIRDSFNMSSITRTSAGVYTLNFTTAMPNANYAISGFANFDESAAPAGLFTAGNDYAPTASSTSIKTSNSTNGAASNSIYVCAVIFSS